LKAAGVTVLTPDKDEEKALEVIIRAVISDQAIPQSVLDKIPITTQSEQTSAVNYINNHPSSPPVLLGCTELSCAFAEKPNTIDPMNILLRYLTTKGVL
jgi:aspartate racemase